MSTNTAGALGLVPKCVSTGWHPAPHFLPLCCSPTARPARGWDAGFRMRRGAVGRQAVQCPQTRGTASLRWVPLMPWAGLPAKGWRDGSGGEGRALIPGPQAGEQGWARTGYPKRLPVAMNPRGTCSFCVPAVTVFSWAPTEAQREVRQPAFPSRERHWVPFRALEPTGSGRQARGGARTPGHLHQERQRRTKRFSLRFPKQMLLHLERVLVQQG